MLKSRDDQNSCIISLEIKACKLLVYVVSFYCCQIPKILNLPLDQKKIIFISEKLQFVACKKSNFLCIN